MTFTDHATCWLWVAFLRRKSDAFEAFKTWHAAVERETGHKLVTLRADNGGEYLNNSMATYLDSRGISQHLIAPYRHQMDGHAARADRTIADGV